MLDVFFRLARRVGRSRTVQSTNMRETVKKTEFAHLHESRGFIFGCFGLRIDFLTYFSLMFGNTNIYSVAGVSDFAQSQNRFLNLFIPDLLPSRSFGIVREIIYSLLEKAEKTFEKLGVD